MTREELMEDLTFHKDALKNLRTAYLAISSGGVSSYNIGTRTVTKHDLPTLSKEMAGHRKEIRSLEVQLSGGKPRKAVATVIRDW